MGSSSLAASSTMMPMANDTNAPSTVDFADCRLQTDIGMQRMARDGRDSQPPLHKHRQQLLQIVHLDEIAKTVFHWQRMCIHHWLCSAVPQACNMITLLLTECFAASVGRI
jgi:hypothetical protein